MVDERVFQLLKEITKHKQVTKAEVMRILQLSERQFHYDFEKLNYALKSLNFPSVILENNSFIVDQEVLNAVKSGRLNDINPRLVTISEEDRVFLIYLYTFIRKEPLSNFHYQSILKVSKNTALADVKKTKELCESWDIHFIYTRNDGYHLIGNEFDKVRLAIYTINTLLGKPLGKKLLVMVLKEWNYTSIIEDTKKVFNEILEYTSINLVKSRKNEILILLLFLRVRDQGDKLNFPEYQKQLIARQKIFPTGREIANRLFRKEAVNESYFVTLLILISLQENYKYENAPLEELADRIIQEFERVTLLPIDNRESLKKSLYDHLVPAFFRITFKIPLVNPLISRIKEEYAELFEFVRKSLAPLTLWTGQEISEEEIGYFTLHFGGYLNKDRRSNIDEIHALVVCSTGVSSSLMLKAQLTEMFPGIHFLNVRSADQIVDIPTRNYDLIFSTVDIMSVKPVYIVKPLLSQVEKNYLIQNVAKDFPRLNYRSISADQLMKVISKYTDIKDEEKLFSELVDILYFKSTKKGRYSPMLSELLTKEMIHFTDEKLEWKDAIALAAQPLVGSQKVEKRYVEAMIKNVEELGTYIHIGKGIAIPHARPEAGVNQIGMSLLRTKIPTLLLDQEDHPIDIFICIAAIDNETHLKALAQLTKILADQEKLQALKQAETPEKIIAIIKKGEGN